MSVYVEAIMPYNFRETADNEKTLAELNRVCERLKKYFHIQREFEYDVQEYDNSDGVSLPNRYSFRMPFDGIDIEVCNGFIWLSSAWRHSKYFFILDGRQFLRNKFYDIVHALGGEYAYIADEFHAANHVYANDKELGDYDFTLETYLEEFPDIPDMPEYVFHSPDDSKWPEIEDLYKDEFYNCELIRTQLEVQYPQYRILTIEPICGKYILVTEGEELKLLNYETGKCLRCGHIDGINAEFNTAGFVVYKGNKCAFFTPEGKKLTPYLVRKYDWRWEGMCDNIVVYDKKTKKTIYIQKTK